MHTMRHLSTAQDLRLLTPARLAGTPRAIVETSGSDWYLNQPKSTVWSTTV